MNSRQPRTRRSSFLLMTAATATIGAITLGAGISMIRHSVDQRKSRFDIPKDADHALLSELAYRLDRGYRLKAWELSATAAAYRDIVEHWNAGGFRQDDAYRHAIRCRVSYSVFASMGETRQPGEEDLRRWIDWWVQWLENEPIIHQEDLGELSWLVTVVLKCGVSDHQQLESFLEPLTKVLSDRLDEKLFAEWQRIFQRIEAYCSMSGRPIELAGPTLLGEAIDLNDYRGRWVLIDFWSTSCGPCLAEFPELRRIRQRFKSRGFEIIGIPIDPHPGTVIDCLEDRSVAWPQLWGDHQNRELMEAWGINGVPTGILVDPNGVVDQIGVRVASRDPSLQLERLLEARFRNVATHANAE